MQYTGLHKIMAVAQNMLINAHQSVADVLSKQCSEQHCLDNENKINDKTKNAVKCSICKFFLSQEAFKKHHTLCNNIGNKKLAQMLAIAVLGMLTKVYNS